jgi:hypothetical protein
VRIKALSVFTYKRYEIPKRAIILVIFFLSFPAVGHSSESIPSSAYPHIPEPMIYDLVRSLGAPRGELEVNTLTQYNFENNALEPNPEIEYSFWDGYALELEVDTSVPVGLGTPVIRDYKPSLQGTFSSPKNYHFIHGWQLAGEHHVDENRYSTTAVYLFGYRFNEHWSTLDMAGVRRIAFDSKAYYAGVFNSTLFYSLFPNLVMGIETNWVYKPNLPDMLSITPQVHLKLTKHMNIQLGMGMRRVSHHNYPNPAIRLVFTF